MHRSERDRVPRGMPLATGPDQLIITVRQSGETVVSEDLTRRDPGPDPSAVEQPRLFDPAPAQIPGQLGLGT